MPTKTVWSLSADGTSRPLIAFVGATQAAVPPAAAAFAEHFPEAELWNVIDDRLIVDAVAAGGVTPDLGDRMARLIGYALEGGARGVLLTCSLYGPVAHRLVQNAAVPVHAADDAAFEHAVASGYSRLLLISSLADALKDAHARFTAFARERHSNAAVVPVLAEAAFGPASRGDTEAASAALAQAVATAQLEGAPADAILLAQYSLSPAASRLERMTGLPVIAGAPLAAARMRAEVRREPG